MYKKLSWWLLNLKVKIKVKIMTLIYGDKRYREMLWEKIEAMYEV